MGPGQETQDPWAQISPGIAVRRMKSWLWVREGGRNPREWGDRRYGTGALEIEKVD